MGELHRQPEHRAHQRVLLSATLMRCPRCDQFTLERRMRDGVEIDVCTRCSGVWLDNAELEQLCQGAQGEVQANLQTTASEQTRARCMKGQDIDDN